MFRAIHLRQGQFAQLLKVCPIIKKMVNLSRKHMKIIIAVAALVISTCITQAAAQVASTYHSPGEINAAKICLPYATDANRAEIEAIAAMDPSTASIVTHGTQGEKATLSRKTLFAAGPLVPILNQRLDEIEADFNSWVPLTPMEANTPERQSAARENQLWIGAMTGMLDFNVEDMVVLSQSLSETSYPFTPQLDKETYRDTGIEAISRVRTQLANMHIGRETAFVAGLFGFRESIEACVVIMAIFVFLKKVVGVKINFRAAMAGLIAALFVSVGMAWTWASLAGALRSETTYIVFGVVSIVLLLTVTNVNFHPIYFGKWMGMLRKLSMRGEFWASFLIPFVALLREGLEMSLSMTTLSLEAGWSPILQGLGVGIPIGILAVIFLTKVFKIVSQRHLLITSGVFVFIAVSSFAGLFVASLARQGVFTPHALPSGWPEIPIWATILFGFSSSWEGLLTPFLIAAIIFVPWGIVRIPSLIRSRQRRLAALATKACQH